LKRSKIFAGALVVLPAAGLLAFTQLADAHYPDISATTACVDTRAQVTIEVTSWTETNEPLLRVDRDITVTWDSQLVGRGEFTPANNYHFTVVLTVPADGTTHIATATAVAPFGPNGEYGFEGSFRQVSVTLPATCPPPPTTTVAPPPTTTVAPPPTTTVAPPPTTTTGPQTEVLGETVTRPAVAVPVEVLPRFAG